MISINPMNSRSKTLLAWGAMDALAILWYCLNAMKKGNTPYVSDFISTQELLISYGPEAMYLVVISWGFQLSLFASCVMFLCRNRLARYIGYIQIPIRLFLLLPSIALISVLSSFIPVHAGIFIALMVVSEALKAWSLWRYA
jgi:hypothetical protein